MIIAMIDLEALKQFLYEGDIFGFLQSIYVNAFQSADLFYAVVALAIVIPIYIRTKSLVFCAIAWIILGSLFIVASPLVSSIAILLVVMGVASLLYQTFQKVKG